MVCWKPPDLQAVDIDPALSSSIQQNEIVYEVMLCEKGKEGRYKSVYRYSINFFIDCYKCVFIYIYICNYLQLWKICMYLDENMWYKQLWLKSLSASISLNFLNCSLIIYLKIHSWKCPIICEVCTYVTFPIILIEHWL